MTDSNTNPERARAIEALAAQYDAGGMPSVAIWLRAGHRLQDTASDIAINAMIAFAASERPERETGEALSPQQIDEMEERCRFLRDEIIRCNKVIDEGRGDSWWHQDRDRFQLELRDLRAALATPLPSGGDQSQEARVIESVLAMLPRHAASLTIRHNEHLDYYSTVAREIEQGGHGMDKWVSPKEKQRAIDTNEAWIMQWYPVTPIGFYTLAASSLTALLLAALSVQSEEGHG